MNSILTSDTPGESICESTGAKRLMHLSSSFSYGPPEKQSQNSALNRGESYIKHIPQQRIAGAARKWPAVIGYLRE